MPAPVTVRCQLNLQSVAVRCQLRFAVCGSKVPALCAQHAQSRGCCLLFPAPDPSVHPIYLSKTEVQPHKVQPTGIQPVQVQLIHPWYSGTLHSGMPSSGTLASGTLSNFSDVWSGHRGLYCLCPTPIRFDVYGSKVPAPIQGQRVCRL